MGIKKDAFFRHMVRVAVVTENKFVMNELETALAHAHGNPVKAVAEILYAPDRFPGIVQEANTKFKLDNIPKWMQLARSYGVETLKEYTIPSPDILSKVRAGQPPRPRQSAEVEPINVAMYLIPPNAFLSILRRESLELYNILNRNIQEKSLLISVLKDNEMNREDKIKRVYGILLRLILLDYLRERHESRQSLKGLKEASSVNRDQVYKVIMAYLDYLDVKE